MLSKTKFTSWLEAAREACLRKRVIMVTHTELNNNEYRPCHELLLWIFSACNQRPQLINFHENRSNWVWNKSVPSYRMPEVVPKTLGPKIRKYLDGKLSTRQNQRHLLRKRQTTNTEIFVFIASLVFKWLSCKVLFINRKRQ